MMTSTPASCIDTQTVHLYIEKESVTYMNRIVISDVRDIDLEHVFECGQCFRWVPAEDGTGDYIGAAGRHAARIRLADRNEDDIAAGSSRSPERRCDLEITATGGDEDFWRSYFDLDTDYRAIKDELVRNEPCIESAVRYGYGIRILRQDLFETLISFIVSQNNNIPRIRKCIEALCRRYGECIGEAFGRQWHAFPEPEVLAAASEEDLAALRLGYRAGYIRAAAERFVSDKCSCCLPETREEILSYRGVGPKVANCIMLFGLRDVAAFPVDTWVRHIMNDMYGIDEGNMKEMERFAREKFGNLAGYAQQYLFYYYRDRKDK